MIHPAWGLRPVTKGEPTWRPQKSLHIPPRMTECIHPEGVSEFPTQAGSGASDQELIHRTNWAQAGLPKERPGSFRDRSPDKPGVRT